MVNNGPSNTDSALEALIDKIETISNLTSGKLELDYRNINKVLNNFTKSSVLMEFDTLTRTISCNEVYEIIAKHVEHMKPSKPAEIRKNVIGTISEPDFEITCITAQDSSFLDSTKELFGMPMIGVDVRSKFEFKMPVLVDFINKNYNQKLRKVVYKVVANRYDLQPTKRGESYFVATNKEFSEGYLLVTDLAQHGELPLQQILEVSSSESKTESMKNKDAQKRTRLYEIMADGKVKRRIPNGSSEFVTCAQSIQVVVNSLFGVDHDYETQSVDAFLNGSRVSVKSMLLDQKEILLGLGKNYIKTVKPILKDGVITYTLPDGRKLSQDLDVFLNKISTLYWGDRDLARRSIPGLTVVQKTDNSSIYG